MRDYLRGFVEGNLTIDPTSWHAKMYEYWRAKASYKTVGYNENLCHYVRVVLFWAPLMWVRHMRILKVPLWGILLVATDAILFVVGFVYATDGLEEGLVLLGAIGAILCLVLLAEKYSKAAEKVAKVLLAPIWAPIYGMVWAVCEVCERYESQPETVRTLDDHDEAAPVRTTLDGRVHCRAHRMGAA